LSGTPGPEDAGEERDVSLDNMEKLLITRVIKKHGGNVSKAARELGISRAALYRRMEKHGL
jgi:transcriptional regulator of acetoin/glycerol metabolism